MKTSSDIRGEWMLATAVADSNPLLNLQHKDTQALAEAERAVLEALAKASLRPCELHTGWCPDGGRKCDACLVNEPLRTLLAVRKEMGIE